MAPLRSFVQGPASLRPAMQAPVAPQVVPYQRWQGWQTSSWKVSKPNPAEDFHDLSGRISAALQHCHMHLDASTETSRGELAMSLAVAEEEFELLGRSWQELQADLEKAQGLLLGRVSEQRVMRQSLSRGNALTASPVSPRVPSCAAASPQRSEPIAVRLSLSSVSARSPQEDLHSPIAEILSAACQSGRQSPRAAILAATAKPKARLQGSVEEHCSALEALMARLGEARQRRSHSTDEACSRLEPSRRSLFNSG